MVSPPRPPRWFLFRRARPRPEIKRSDVATPRPPKVENGQVDWLLREIAELRLSAATHLTIAAAAMDAGRPDIASELIEAQQRDVADLRKRASELLAVDGAVADEARRYVLNQAIEEESVLQETAVSAETRSLRNSARRSTVVEAPRRTELPRSREPRRWSGAGALLAVVATVALTLMQPFSPSDPPDQGALQASTIAALDANVVRSYQQLERAAAPSSDHTTVEDAARRLQADLQLLLPAAAQDPVAARRLLEVLSAERALLSENHPEALVAYEAEAERIVSQLRALASPAVLAMLPLPGEIAGDPEQAAESLLSAIPAPTDVALPTPPDGPSDGGGGSSSAGGGTSVSTGSGTGADSSGGLGASDPVPLPPSNPDPVISAPVVPLPIPTPDPPVDLPPVNLPGDDGTPSGGSGNEGGSGTDGTTGSQTNEPSGKSSGEAELPQIEAPSVAPVLPAPPILDNLTR